MRILIATDGSPVSQNVQKEVAARAWPEGTEVRLLHVVHPGLYPIPGSLGPAMQSARKALESAAASLRDSAALRVVSPTIIEGYPADNIVEVAQSWNADFIFMGCRGFGPIGRFLLGSTVSAVLHAAPCPVEIVRCARSDRAPHSGAARRILLATDGSSCSELAIESIVQRPWAAGTEIRAISVPAFSGPWIETSYIDLETWNAIHGGAVVEANHAVEMALARFGRSGLRADGTVPEGLEGPKALILDEAERWKADLIVAGAHGYNRIDRLLLGSVSEALALYAKCSVEVIREKRVRPVLQASEVARPGEFFMKSPGVAIASSGGA